jgi:hypothetical protein
MNSNSFSVATIIFIFIAISTLGCEKEVVKTVSVERISIPSEIRWNEGKCPKGTSSTIPSRESNLKTIHRLNVEEGFLYNCNKENERIKTFYFSTAWRLLKEETLDGKGKVTEVRHIRPTDSYRLSAQGLCGRAKYKVGERTETFSNECEGPKFKEAPENFAPLNDEARRPIVSSVPPPPPAPSTTSTNPNPKPKPKATKRVNLHPMSGGGK